VNTALTLGVIGHVDHGKTALVRALTGIETDRLKEERDRGLSIVLGFAYLETDRGVIDLIDVPGHEAFIRAMIGGATALDGIVLCVAANEGVMPQTVEHFNIARLLRATRGFVVITKADLVDAETLDLAREEIADFVRGSFLEGAPVIAVSSVSGAGIDAVRDRITELADEPVEHEDSGRFFMPLDRVFTMKGFGLVATGTLRGGSLGVGDTVEIQPRGRAATVRALQNHNRAVDLALPGQRVAVNLRHVDVAELSRGDVISLPGSVAPATRADIELELLADAGSPLRNGTIIRLLTGTTEAMARLRLLDRRELIPGEVVLAQAFLDREIATTRGERFLIRSVSPMRTIGGGKFLEINPKRHRRFDEAVTRRLESVASGNRREVVSQRLGDAGRHGLDLDTLGDEVGAGREELDQILDRLDVVRIGDGTVVSREVYQSLQAEVLEIVTRFHTAEPMRSGLDTGALAKALGPETGVEVMRYAIQSLVADRHLASLNGILSVPGFDPFSGLNQRERLLVDRIESQFRDYGLEPPAPQGITGGDKLSQAVLGMLLDAGRLVRLRTYKNSADLVLHSGTLQNARQAIEQAFPYPQAFALKDIRDLLGSTRKFIVPLMEHFDNTGVTTRHGDIRRLRER